MYNLGHTDSQSETVKAGAVNGAYTNCRFTNWRSKTQGKIELAYWTISSDH